MAFTGAMATGHRLVLLNPALFQLLPDVKGKRVLDAGCGEGYLSRKLARLGAVEYIPGHATAPGERMTVH